MATKNNMTHKLGLLLLATALLAMPATAQTVSGTLDVNDSRLQGTSPDGDVLLNAPDPLQGGSSLSHWDPSAFPNLLMEPAINADLPFLGLDISPDQMADMGWNQGTSNFTVTSLDGPDSGFNDLTPFAGAPGNDAATLGEARINLVNAVLSAWGETLGSEVQIDILAGWDTLECSQTGGAALAGAGSIFVFRDDEGGLPIPNAWYHAALAESLSGVNETGPVDPVEGVGDIFIIFNVQIDQECLGPGTGFYYGLDGNAPDNQIDLVPVVLHEIAHGLGMSTFTDGGSGLQFLSFPSAYDFNMLDNSTGKTWDEMTNAERVESAVNVRKLAWQGGNTTAAAASVLEAGVPELTITEPPELAGIYEVGTALWGADLADGPFSGELGCLIPIDGCTLASNPEEVEGKFAIVNRGTCLFTEKASVAQNAGASGLIIINNQGNTPIPLGGANSAITIPVVSVGQDDGALLRSVVCLDDPDPPPPPPNTLVLTRERFHVTLDWTTPSGQNGPGIPVQLTDDTGYFWFFVDTNVEVVVKILDACGQPNPRFWVFGAGLTNVAVEMTVTDTVSDVSQTYTNAQGDIFEPIQDVSTFNTCP